MNAPDPQYSASEILRSIHQDQVYLFLGSAFVTVGIVAAGFSLLRRRLDPLLLWLALFAFLYGTRLWTDTGLIRFELPHTSFFLNLEVAIGYLVPIPAFFFFREAGFLTRFSRILVPLLAAIFLALFVAALLGVSRSELDLINDTIVIMATIAGVVLSFGRRNATPDFIVIRRGLLVFAAFVIYGNISGLLHRYQRVEPYGFAVFLGCLGYVAARQTVEREAQFGEIQKELEIAKRIQLSILPGNFPESTDFSVTARYLPMTSVAGDFYDFLISDSREAGLLIADVSGHGVPAALIASMVKLAASSQRDNVRDPAELLRGMNLSLCGNTQQQFITAAYVHLDAKTGELRYSAAGHPPMLLLRNGEVVEIEENGLMLAAFTFSGYSNHACSLQPGDRLLLYTDGILEAANEAKEEFGQKRLQALLQKSAGLPQSQAVELILSTVQQWSVTQDDDLTLLVCDYSRKSIRSEQNGGLPVAGGASLELSNG
ncbi:Serine phosphatase RsbU, regulator of sigma subunit [Acidisarcina polymorpha]|uniref:Serine phosphatase RsbU, regulator of sigma subunit n=1 Tax=Acidisarcina polymorpha TaxID=2211140 RepID=A0A2Z5FX56_9BACT|nr:PP2C family protein-serine/threonine phosphatase [Acidisarcina polymorpha]AXC11094.1 Serine phosphatase RsbU, regulator of sigma subunit [Acidisarcina polymorpha]